MNHYFFEIFENVPRQGPGLNASTRKAFNAIRGYLPKNPAILDVGCGKGVQTIELARTSTGHITALDNHPYFLECLRKEAGRTGFSDRIECVQGDMQAMPFHQACFDLIWSEGAVFIVGIKEGLRSWKKLLKPDGYMVLTDLVWLSDSRPADLTAYFEEECLNVLTVNEVLAEAAMNAYACIDHFTLPDEGWTRAFYAPLQNVVAGMRGKYRNKQEAQETFDAFDREREIVTRNLNHVGYEFFILKNNR